MKKFVKHIHFLFDIFSDGIPIKGNETGIHMTLSREGRPSGEAYIELDTEEDIPKAEKKHNQHMGRRYIEGNYLIILSVYCCIIRKSYLIFLVFVAKRSEMEWVIKRANADPGHEDDCCVRLRGLPFGCSKEEIMQFFSGKFEIIEDNETKNII